MLEVSHPREPPVVGDVVPLQKSHLESLRGGLAGNLLKHAAVVARVVENHHRMLLPHPISQSTDLYDDVPEEALECL